MTLLSLSLSPVARADGGDPDGSENLAAESSLPSGAGLAAEFKDDANIDSHPAVVFADNFERGDLGARWNDQRNRDGAVLSLENAGRGERSLKVTAALGKNTGGGLTKWFQPSETVFIRFYCKFDPTCDHVHHFCTLRANKGLRGGDKWTGFGGAGVRPQGNERFSTALEPWGNWGKFDPPGQWNFYSYWHEMKAAPDGKFWGNAFRPAEQPNIERGEWICCEFMLKHNTPGKADGEQAFWIDSELRGHWKGINWRKSSTLWANAFTLEAYVTDRWTKNPVNVVFFDNVVIAEEYIGPAGE